MWTALISGILGIVSGLVPEVIKEVATTRNHIRELEFLRLQHEFQMQRQTAQLEDKMREADVNLLVEEARAFREHLGAIIETQGRPTGVAWIDAFNALIRPTTAAMLVVLFSITSYIYIDGVMKAWSAGSVKDGMQLASIIWGSMIGEAFQAVLGFLFGYRSCRRSHK